MGPKRRMKSRYQRCPLAPSGQIGIAQVCDHIDPGQLGQQGRVVQLPGVSVCAPRLMTHRLAMRADGRDRSGVDTQAPGLFEQIVHRLRVKSRQAVGSQRCPVQFIFTRAVQAQKVLPEL